MASSRVATSVRCGLNFNTQGNISVRLTADDGTEAIVITPSDVRYDAMSPDDMVVVAMDGTVLEGDLLPSTELPLGQVEAHGHGNQHDALALQSRLIGGRPRVRVLRRSHERRARQDSARRCDRQQSSFPEVHVQFLSPVWPVSWPYRQY